MPITPHTRQHLYQPSRAWRKPASTSHLDASSAVPGRHMPSHQENSHLSLEHVCTEEDTLLKATRDLHGDGRRRGEESRSKKWDTSCLNAQVTVLETNTATSPWTLIHGAATAQTPLQYHDRHCPDPTAHLITSHKHVLHLGSQGRRQWNGQI